MHFVTKQLQLIISSLLVSSVICENNDTLEPMDYITDSYNKFYWRNHGALNIAKRDQAFIMFQTDQGLYYHINGSECFNDNSAFTVFDDGYTFTDVNVLKNYFIIGRSRANYICTKPIYSNAHSDHSNRTRCSDQNHHNFPISALAHSTGTVYMKSDKDELTFETMTSDMFAAKRCIGTLIPKMDLAGARVHATSFKDRADIVVLYTERMVKWFNLAGDLLGINVVPVGDLLQISSNQLDIYQTVDIDGQVHTTVLDYKTIKPDTRLAVIHGHPASQFRKMLFSNRYAIAVFTKPDKSGFIFELYTTELCPGFDAAQVNARTVQNAGEFECLSKAVDAVKDFFLVDPILYSIPDRQPPNSIIERNCDPKIYTENRPIYLYKEFVFWEIATKSVAVLSIFFMTLCLLGNFHLVKGSKDSLLLNNLSNKQILIKLKDD